MLEKMKEIIAEQLNCDAESITLETSFKEDLGADSLDLFELVMALEDEYSVEIPSEELQDLTTVGAVIDYLKAKGVEEIKTVGETFDPELHEAVSSVQDETKGEKEIVQEYRKRYKIGSKVIRHSMVVVAN